MPLRKQCPRHRKSLGSISGLEAAVLDLGGSARDRPGPVSIDPGLPFRTDLLERERGDLAFVRIEARARLDVVGEFRGRGSSLELDSYETRERCGQRRGMASVLNAEVNRL